MNKGQKGILAILLAATAFLGTGCGGINAGGSVSPATFFLPGIIRNDTNQPAQPGLPPAPAVAVKALPTSQEL